MNEIMTTTNITIDDAEPYEIVDGKVWQRGKQVAHSINNGYSDDTDTHKKCRQCKEIKPRFEFHKDAGKRDGLKLKCRECTKVNHANNR